MKRNLIILLFFAVTGCSPATDPFEAYRKGDYKTAANGLKLLSEKNEPDAMAHLGVMYQMGLGVKKDLNKAHMYYEKAAKQNHAPAQYNLALLYQAGLGVEQSYETAYKYFSLAAKQDHEKAKLATELLLTELKVTIPAINMIKREGAD